MPGSGSAAPAGTVLARPARGQAWLLYAACAVRTRTAISANSNTGRLCAQQHGDEEQDVQGHPGERREKGSPIEIFVHARVEGMRSRAG